MMGEWPSPKLFEATIARGGIRWKILPTRTWTTWQLWKNTGIRRNEMADYNGWANYETWCVNLWLTNEPGTEEDLRMLAQTNTGLSHRADCLRDYVLNMDPPLDDSNMFTDLLRSALGNVDWREIIENHEHDD